MSTPTQQFTHLATEQGVKAIYIHDLAIEEIQKMYQRVEEIKRVFGPHDEYVKAATSLNHCLSKLFLTGFAPECYITRDGDLSLYVNEGNVFVFGIIFFRDRAYDEVEDTDPRKGLAGEWSAHS